MKQEDYKELISAFKHSLDTPTEKPLETEDDKLTNAVATQKVEREREYKKRDGLYTQLLKEYIDVYTGKEEDKKKYKKAFFIIVMIIFIIIIIGCVASICYISIEGAYDLESVGIVFSNVAGIISAIIVIPQIIAKHLFPTNEEKFMIDMVTSMQNNDAGIRDIIFSENSNNEE